LPALDFCCAMYRQKHFDHFPGTDLSWVQWLLPLS
jgi:hypothetical protein